MSVSNSAVFNRQPGVGADTNAGFFVPGGSGTDRSQTAAAFITFDGATIFATTSGTSATIVVTGATVSANDVNNGVRITGGTNFIAGLYQIASVNTGTNSYTLDRNCTSGAGLAMVAKMGGAIATLAQFITDANANTNVLGGYKCYVKGSETLTSAQVMAGTYNTNANGGSTGTLLGGIQQIGYTTTPGDGGRATLTTATNSTDLIHGSSGLRSHTFINFSFTTTAVTKAGAFIQTANGHEPSRLGFDNCVFDGFTRAIYFDAANDGWITGLHMRGCEVKNCTTAPITNASGTFLTNCYVHDNTGDGVLMPASGANARGPLFLLRSVFYNNTLSGAFNSTLDNAPNNLDQHTFAYHCAFVKNGAAGLRCSVSGNNGCVIVSAENNIFYFNGTYGAQTDTLYSVLMMSHNAYGANGTAAQLGFGAQSGDVTLTADPFTSYTTGDFTLNSTSGGGTACKGAGVNGADIGPYQSAGGGSTTTVIVPSINRSIYVFGEEGRDP